MITPRLITLSLIVLVAAFSRLLPHPDNVTPIAALALFAGVYLEKKWLAFALPLLSMLLSDAILGFHSSMWGVYLGFALITCLGFLLKEKARILTVAAAATLGSVVFFITSNFAVWLSAGLYPLTTQGLAQCFVAAIPFYQNTLLGDLFYTGLLFAGFAQAEQRFAWLRSSPLKTA
ncbi:MAG: DUF6580 family putative transport protein [Alphaproteobacteria bacterium]|nr:DUF6580 family putative transport protein [Alphaproteobacteria bacterium]